MKLNTVLLPLFLLTSNQIFSWEWPLSLKLGWFGSWFMDKDQRHFNSVLVKLKNKTIEAQTKSPNLFVNSYKKHLKQLMTPIQKDKDYLKALSRLQEQAILHKIAQSWGINAEHKETDGIELEQKAAKAYYQKVLLKIKDQQPVVLDTLQDYAANGHWLDQNTPLPSLQNFYKEKNHTAWNKIIQETESAEKENAQHKYHEAILNS